MGTNFYWKDVDKLGIPEDLPGDRTHLGKRCAAGYYCSDCNVPLVLNGDVSLVHTSHKVHLDHCPVCGKLRPEFSLENSSAGVELGFAKPKTGKPTGGIHYCSSFIWAQSDTMISALCDQHKDEEVIEDEYGRGMTGEEFMQMIFSNCPIQYHDSIGHEFS